MNSHFVDNDEAMKRGDEALNASSYQFLRSVKRSLLYRYIFLLSFKCFIAPLLFTENRCLTLHRRYFFKVIHRLTLHRRYFLK
jgi:hypothetical protein